MTKYRLDAAEIFAVKEQERSDYLEKVLAQILRGAKTFEDVINKGWRQFFTAALPAYAADFCELVRRLPRCSYQYSSYRRSFRSAEPGDYFGFLTAFLAEAYRDWQNFDLREYIQTNQHLVTDWDIVAKQPAKMTISALLALKIDQGDQNIIQLIKEMIFSDRNTAVLDHQIFRAVAASQNAELHKLMADLLLAAKLQEGLRQAILETADDGVLEYFMVLIKTVLDNDLMRFSSALRAVCVWTGLGYDYADRRVAEKILRLGYQYLTSAADRAAAHKSGDVTEMYAAMWAESVISAQNLHQCIQRSLQGAKYQKHVAAYFLTETLDSYWYHGPPRPHLDQAVKTAGAWLTAADLDLSALLAASYKVTWHSVTDDYSNPYYSSDKSPDKTKINQKKYPLCLQDAAVRAAHFEKFSQMIEKIPAGGHQLTGKPFPWHSAVLTREKVFELMMILAAYDGDKKKEARLWELAAKENPVSKMNFVRFFVCREISGRARNFLLELLADKNMQVRIYALRQLKTLTLTPSDIVRVADLLSLKTGEIRQTALELLKNTDDNILLGITQNLLTAKNANKRLAALDLLIYAKKSGKVTSAQAREMTQTMPQPTAAEMILLDNLLNNAAEYTPENGFGLYDPLYFPEFPAPERSSEYTLAAFRAITLTEMTEVWQSLLALVKEHQGKEYKAVSRYGSSWDGVFGNEKYLAQVTITDSPATIEDYFLGEVWGGWLEKNAARLLTILKIHYLCQMRPIHSWRYTAKEYTLENLEPFAQDLIVNLLGTEAQNFRQNIPAEFSQLVENIIQTLLGLKV
ncbi:MAG: hypothetical protein LBR56_04755, partial [Sporomusaceae bacterium]|nr:hypothetical protein [Sporomusaceae bacterium]